MFLWLHNKSKESRAPITCSYKKARVFVWVTIHMCKHEVTCCQHSPSILDIAFTNCPRSFYTWLCHVCIYRPRSRGDNTFGSVRLPVSLSVFLSVRLSICPFVHLSVLSCLNSKTQKSATLLKTSQSVQLKEHSKWLDIQNGCCFDRLRHHGRSRF